MSDVQGAEANAGAENAAVAQNGDIEATARRMGWRPKTEFKGDEAKWVDADSFVAKVQDEVPVLKRTLRDMDQKFARLEKKFEEQTQVLTDFRDFASRGEQRSYERALAELKSKRDIAVASADMAGFNSVQAEIEKLNVETKPTTTAKPAEKIETEVQQAPPREITDWIAENPWYNNDTVLHNAAKGLDQQFLKDAPGMSLADRLAAVKAEVQKRWPEKFGNTRRDAAGAVLTPGSTSNGRKPAKSYDNLPAEAKKACDKFVKTIKGFTREQYVKDYDWTEA